MSANKKILLLIVFLFSFSGITFATHIVGGELNYKYLGNNQFEIRLTVYRDCYNGIPPFDNPASLGIFNANNQLVQNILLTFLGSDTLPPTINSPCFIPPTNICYEVTTYIDTIFLPASPGGYQLVYQRCCRNQTILNIVQPLSTGATYYASIPPSGTALVNSNPVFNQWPPPFICQNVPFVFDHSATDADGDSIYYELCIPYHGADTINPMPQPPNNPPYPNILWNPGYSLANMLGAGTPLSIDPVTGLLTVTPGLLGQFVIGICASEFRNGVLLSHTRRDFQLNVVACPTLVVAAIQFPQVVCGSNLVKFTNKSIGAATYFWNFGDPTTNADTSHGFSPTYNYPDTGCYSITMYAFSGIDPDCADTTIDTVCIYPDYTPGFYFTQAVCTYDVQFTDTSNTVSGATTIWNWKFGDGGTAAVHNPAHAYSAGGTYTVTFTATSANGCIDTVLKTVVIHPLLAASTIATGVKCSGDCNGQAAAVPVNGTAPYTFQWNDPAFQTTATATGLCTGNYTVTITDSNGCTATQNVNVPSPAPLSNTITSTDAYCGGLCIGTATMNVSGGSTPYTYSWNDPSNQQTKTAAELCPGMYTVFVTDKNGCTITDSVEVLFSNALPLLNATVDDDTIFLGQTTTAHATVLNGYIYTWSPPGGLSSVSSSDPNASPVITTTYYITITDSNGCQNTDSVRIVVKIPLCDEPEIYVPNAFTPNGDNINDKVFVRGNLIKEMEFAIFDRWGEKVFETYNPKDGWDGNYKGKSGTPAVFVYYLKATCYNNAKYYKKGNITLLR